MDPVAFLSRLDIFAFAVLVKPRAFEHINRALLATSASQHLSFTGASKTAEAKNGSGAFITCCFTYSDPAYHLHHDRALLLIPHSYFRRMTSHSLSSPVPYPIHHTPLGQPTSKRPHPHPIHYDTMGMSFWRLVAYVSPPSSQDLAPGLGLRVVGERSYGCIP